MKHRYFLLFFIGCIALSNSSFSQIVGTDVFLQGQWLEVGVDQMGAFGTCSSPAGYHAHACCGSTICTTSGAAMDASYDWGHDGWSVGTPCLMGPYTEPGFPQEGWSLEVAGTEYKNWASGGLCTGDFDIPGSITGYTNSGGTITGTFTGNIAGLHVVQQSRVDTFASWAVVTTTMYNTTAAPITGVYYERTCDPDNASDWGGGSTTENVIVHQNEDERHMVEIGTYSNSGVYDMADSWMSLCTKDCRAKCGVIPGLEPSNTPSDLWGNTGTVITALGDSNFEDEGIFLVYNIGTIGAGDSAIISYSYVYNSRTGIDSSLPDPQLVVDGTPVPNDSLPIPVYDTFSTCAYPGLIIVPVNIMYGADKDWSWSKWTWSPSTGLSATTGVNNFVNVNALSGMTTYTITGTDSSSGTMLNCSNRVFYLTIIPCFHATNNGPCINDTLWLVGHGDSTGATYYWYGPSGYVALTQSAYRTGLTWADTGVYHVVKTAGGANDTVSTDVTFRGIPIVTASSNGPVCSGPGNTLLLSATPDTAVGETFSWTGPNGFTSVIQNPSITAPVMPYGGFYKVVTTSTNGCMDSVFIAVTIDSTPAIPTISSNTPVCSAPRGTLLLNSGDATVGVSYSWSGPNTFTSPLQNPTIVPVYVPASGTYTVTVSIPYAGITCSSQNTTVVVVDSTPFLPVMTSNAPLCSGNTLNLTSASSNFSTYSWIGPNSFISGIQNPSIGLVTTPATGIYSVTATYFYPGGTGILGCISDTATLMVVVDSTPAFPTASSNSPGPLGGGPSICQGDTLKLVSADTTAGVSYSWAGAAGYTSTEENPYIANVYPAATGLYTVTAILGMCSSSTVITVSITPTPAVIATSNSPVCSGNADTLFLQVISDPGTTFIWSGPYVFASTAQSIYRTPVKMEYAGVYQVTSYLNGCASLPFNDTVTIRQTPAPPVVPWLTYCRNFDAPPLQAMGDSIEWFPTDVINGGSFIAPVPPTASDTVMWFFMTQTVEACMSALDSMKITVNPQPAVTVNQDVAVCPHDSVTLTAVDTDPIAYYHWFPGLYLSDTSGPSVITRPENDMHYTVVASNQYGCTDTAMVTVKVNSGAVIYLGDSVTLYPGQTYQISPSTNCTSFAWFPASGLSDAYISNPIASPALSTKYIVHGATSWGCTAEDSIEIYVSDETLLALPNAFTPGSGSPNSEFKIIMQGIATLNYFRIFDRWGVMVYEGTDINQGWDGNYKGAPQPLGVYVYEISAVTSTGRQFIKHGNVTLIR